MPSSPPAEPEERQRQGSKAPSDSVEDEPVGSDRSTEPSKMPPPSEEVQPTAGVVESKDRRVADGSTSDAVDGVAPTRLDRPDSREPHSNGRLNGGSDTDGAEPVDGDIGDAVSAPDSPPLGDEIVVHDDAAHDRTTSANDEDESMADASPDDPAGADGPPRLIDASASAAVKASPYPKRKRTASKIARANGEADVADPPSLVADAKLDRTTQPPKASTPKGRAAKTAASVVSSPSSSSRKSLGNGKMVLLGHWRDSPAPDDEQKHAAVGFIDVRERLRTRVQGWNRKGEHITHTWPLAAKSGAIWVTFDGIVFLPHLVGLDQLQIKEYVRIRGEALEALEKRGMLAEETAEAREAAEAKAVQDAVQTARQAALADRGPSFSPQPLIAYGAQLPESAKRRRTSGSFTAAGPVTGAAETDRDREPTALDPLHGTRPTRILLGVWSKSDADTREGRHAIYGILGQNDMFRVKLVRETRTGEFRDGNFPPAAGALWIPYEEVDFDPHLKGLTRAEVKEYCRARQYQIDRGEGDDERVANEAEAVRQARDRISRSAGSGAGAAQRPGDKTSVPAQIPSTQRSEPTPDRQQPAASRTSLSGGQELRSSRRVEAMKQQQQQQQQQQRQRQNQRQQQGEEGGQQPSLRHQRSQRSLTQQARRQEDQQPVTSNGRRSLGGSSSGSSSVDAPTRPNHALDKTARLAQRELARAEATQGRADLQTLHRQRAATAAATAAAEAEVEATTAAAAAAAAAATGSRSGTGSGSGSDPTTTATTTNGNGNGTSSSTITTTPRIRESDDIRRLNDIWARQESRRARALGGDDTKIYDGVKYERKTNGPFLGKLVSHGSIITIDGEDYVEYRVLMKPSFF
ncbi:hypothetical protein GMORB2_6368 [Geosmithia morbida]|uniref:Uncharacterized protein n=1 Tax=Geosmithia morbida TaxID=1094350 RepID=A0A9P4YXL3_9HYPO|nr:uncharacterized protein GMORB2_6368 [Geosmithia morbida]KAF4123667.1 hypothetical protein GMORB2_6368 [Geosmithia morbida]